jgi:hypothetical protein
VPTRVPLQQVENSLSTYEPHACVIVYSIVQKSSFRCAEEILNYLWRENITKEKGVIVVGNKADLARSRVISTAALELSLSLSFVLARVIKDSLLVVPLEGKQLAASRDVKFIETSSGIQHNVDELLVGILKQVSGAIDSPLSPQPTLISARFNYPHLITINFLSLSFFPFALTHTKDSTEGDSREEAIDVKDEKLTDTLVAAHSEGDSSKDLL